MKHARALTKIGVVNEVLPAPAQDLLVKQVRVETYDQTVGLLMSIVGLIAEILLLRDLSGSQLTES